MLYYSLHNNAPLADFKTATINGQAPDKGLYFPQSIPRLHPSFFTDFEKKSKEAIAFQVIQPFIGNTIPKKELENIVAETVSFPFPLINLDNQLSVLELFHGPTLAFKDVGARFMSRCLGFFLKENDKQVTVLVATSGDTGGAVADGFLGVEGVDVVILYPSGKVSPIQELQLTSHSKNITALEVNGNFDDCQQMVKKAFADSTLQTKLSLTSANSINVARWLPQQFYYFYAYQQWADKENPPVISVPSGNFGNICAGLLAQQMGLPVGHFIAACNANAVVPHFLETGAYKKANAIPTLSNAMDVGDPSNFIRILEIFQQKVPDLKSHISSYSITDTETKVAIQKVHQQFQYIADPHGAVAFAALEKYLQENKDQKGYFVETAHPVKFLEVVEGVLEQKIELPETVKKLMAKQKKSIPISNKYEDLHAYLSSIN